MWRPRRSMGFREADYNIPSAGVSASRKLHNQVRQASSQPLRVLLVPQHFRDRRRDASGLRDEPADSPRVELLKGASFAKGLHTVFVREPSCEVSLIIIVGLGSECVTRCCVCSGLVGLWRMHQAYLFCACTRDAWLECISFICLVVAIDGCRAFPRPSTERRQPR